MGGAYLFHTRDSFVTPLSCCIIRDSLLLALDVDFRSPRVRQKIPRISLTSSKY